MKIPPPAPGIYPNTPMEVYKSWEAFNHSALKLFARSPEHAHGALDDTDEEDDSSVDKDFGTACHIYILERESFPSRVAFKPKLVGEGRNKAYAKFDEENAGKIILPEDRKADILGVYNAIRSNSECRKLALNKGDTEVCLVWKCPHTGLTCKGRIDRLYGQFGLFLDLKTTANASAEEFTKSVLKWGYHSQFAHYCDGLEALGLPVASGRLLVAEKTKPYGCAIYRLSDEFLRIGRLQVRQWLGDAKRCVDAGKWPGYGECVHELHPPNWLEKQWANFEGSEG